MVVATPEDADLYHKIQENVLSAPNKEQPQRLRDFIYHNDEGEKAISRIIKALPDTNFAVLTDDTMYLKRTSEAVRQTTAGNPVVYGGTGAYLDAEINASKQRYIELSRRLKNTEALSVYRVSEDIVKGSKGLGESGEMIMQYYTRATDAATGEKITIGSIIRNAAAKQLNGHAGGNGYAAGESNGAGNKTGWAQEGLKKSGTPGEIAHRAGQNEDRLR
jgi:hypothetical protein